ncbi:DUF4870 domain-containing protein [Microbacterium sp. YJN-G]|uniref:DUF4870 domain-containing protein n=1 Tax=Microbacterium sp. YJN-G TaxID=2763257 RepID=UPI0018785AEC|nr:DUF4870 domain-containing protein [Microbacterium sp. YJN-G]
MSNDAPGAPEPNSGEPNEAAQTRPPAPPAPPAAPTGQPQAGSPVPPPPAGGPSGAPAYGAPGTPPQPGYGAPQQGYGAAQPGYGAPAGAPYGYGAPVQSNITLNLWLSVFFSWIPALIFYLIEKDKVAPQYHRANAKNLNYQLIVTIAYAAVGVLSVITFGLASLLYLVLPIAQLIIGIMHAVNVPPQLAAGQEGKFYLAPDWVK